MPLFARFLSRNAAMRVFVLALQIRCFGCSISKLTELMFDVSCLVLY